MPKPLPLEKSISDVDLVTRIKQEKDQAAELLLLERYKPFVFKYYKKLCKQAPELKQIIDLEDFTTEFYLGPFKQAINYCDPNKIRNNNWKIVQILGWYTKNFIKKYISQVIRGPKIFSYSDLFSDFNDKDATINHDVNRIFRDNSVPFYRKINEKLTFFKFLEKLPERDRRILEDRARAIQETGSPRPLKDMAKSFAIKKTQIHNRIKALLVQYKKFSGY